MPDTGVENTFEWRISKKWRWRDSCAAQGAFAVPGDGGVDFAPLFAAPAIGEYEGWAIVKAEQNSARVNPLEYKKACAYISEGCGYLT